MKEKNDTYWMGRALQEAQKAFRLGEVPVGAVLVFSGKKISAGHNLTIHRQDPTAHAEILCLRRAARRLKNYRLGDTILYVTVEPCAMCAGALFWARVRRVVFGCWDSKGGACGSILNLNKVRGFNHRYQVTSGILEKECRDLMQSFFKVRRFGGELVSTRISSSQVAGRSWSKAP